MGSLAFIIFAAVATVFNIYMWYYELKNKKIFQFIFDLGGTLIIIVLFSAVSATVTGFAIAMIVSATWSLIAIIENARRKIFKEEKEKQRQRERERYEFRKKVGLPVNEKQSFFSKLKNKKKDKKFNEEKAGDGYNEELFI